MVLALAAEFGVYNESGATCGLFCWGGRIANRRPDPSDPSLSVAPLFLHADLSQCLKWIGLPFQKSRTALWLNEMNESSVLRLNEDTPF